MAFGTVMLLFAVFIHCFAGVDSDLCTKRSYSYYNSRYSYESTYCDGSCCGDYNDEYCCSDNAVTVTVVGGSVGGVSAFVLIPCLIFCYIKKYKSGSNRVAQAAPTTSTTVYFSGSSGQYPQG